MLKDKMTWIVTSYNFLAICCKHSYGIHWLSFVSWSVITVDDGCMVVVVVVMVVGIHGGCLILIEMKMIMRIMG